MKNIHIEEDTIYSKFPSEDQDARKIKHITTSFGECVGEGCPFFKSIGKIERCRRAESEDKE